jgi:hypothetical protein
MSSVRGTRAATVAGLVVGAAGIGLLRIGGVKFPVAVPPGIVILLAGALFVAFAPWRWAPGLGIPLGLFITIGFLVSPTGLGNLRGEAGLTVQLGQLIQQLGVITAMIAGALALRGFRSQTAKPNRAQA